MNQVNAKSIRSDDDTTLALAFYVGCYKDSFQNRDLNATSSNKNPGGTVDSCILRCIQLGQEEGLPHGYEYAGVENR